ncbi:fibrinogen-like YCDxxxxGGGW domain-containing protein, partial [Myxococcota bacterium]
MQTGRWVVAGLGVVTLGLAGTYWMGRARAEGIPASQALVYSGLLTSADGSPLTESATIGVAIWDSREGGNSACPDASGALERGRFSVVLSDECADAIHGSRKLWVEVSVDEKPLPRTKLGAVPYAVEAEYANRAGGELASAVEALREEIAGLRSRPGSSPDEVAENCTELLTAGMTASGTYWVKNPSSARPENVGKPVLVYCDQTREGGGWALLYNSVLAPNTLDFWNIPYAERTDRRGQPSLDANFYDGSLYQTGPATYLDTIEDLAGTEKVAFVATSGGINNVTMRLGNPTKLSGDDPIYNSQFAAGWSSSDYDGDTHDSNCATQYHNVTQH